MKNMRQRDSKGRFVKTRKETDSLSLNDNFVSAASFRHNLSIDISNYQNIGFIVNGHKYVIDTNKLEKLIKLLEVRRG